MINCFKARKLHTEYLQELLDQDNDVARWQYHGYTDALYNAGVISYDQFRRLNIALWDRDISVAEILGDK